MRALFTVLAFLALLSGPVIAQEKSLHDFAGGYLGVELGTGSGVETYLYDGGPPGFFTDFPVKGFTGGLAAGYDWKVGAFVLGLNGQISKASIGGEILTLPPWETYPCLSSGEPCTANVDWLGSIGVRAGLPIDKVMPFVTAGLAAGGIRGSVNHGACDFAPVCGFDQLGVGTVFGVGVEVALTENLSVTGELQHVDLGKPTFTAPIITAEDITFNVAKLRANWRF